VFSDQRTLSAYAPSSVWRGCPHYRRSTTLTSKDRSLGAPVYHPKKQRSFLGDPGLPPQETKIVPWGPRSGQAARKASSRRKNRAGAKALTFFRRFRHD
jgi:hypothetical protein